MVVIFPEDTNEVNVPTDVILGCAAVVTVATASPEAVPVSPVPAPINCKPVTLPMALTDPTVLRLPPSTLPTTLSTVIVPTCVILNCVDAVTVCAEIAVVATLAVLA